MPTTTLCEQDFTDDAIGILDMMVKAGLAASKGEARRLVMQGGVSINDQKLQDPQVTLLKKDFSKDVIVKKGKKVFHKFILA